MSIMKALIWLHCVHGLNVQTALIIYMGLLTLQLQEQSSFCKANIFWKLRKTLCGITAQVQCSCHNFCHKQNLFKIKGEEDLLSLA